MFFNNTFTNGKEKVKLKAFKSKAQFLRFYVQFYLSQAEGFKTISEERERQNKEEAYKKYPFHKS